MGRVVVSPFRRKRAGLQLKPVAPRSQTTPDLSRPVPLAGDTPDLVGDLGSRLDAARARLRDAIPPPAE